MLKRLWARIKNTQAADFAERVGSTFAFAFVACLLGSLAAGGTMPSLRALLISAIAAGVSAVKALVKNAPTTADVGGT